MNLIDLQGNALFVVLLFFTLFSYQFYFFSASESLQYTIFQTTDIHANYGDLKHCGIRQVASEIMKQRKILNHDSCWIDCGDLTLGTLQATFDHGLSMVHALNTANCDIWVPGNHDFEFGFNHAIENFKTFQGTVLAANLKFDHEFQPVPWKLLKSGPLRIAVIGITPPFLDSWIFPDFLKQIYTFDVIGSLSKIMPQVMKSKPHAIILAIHLGEFSSKRLTHMDKVFSISSISSQFPQIDVFLIGHSHQTEAGKCLYNGKWLVQAPPLGEGTVRIDLEFDPKESPIKLLSVQSKILKPDLGVEIDININNVLEKSTEMMQSLGKQPIAKINFPLTSVKDSKSDFKSTMWNEIIANSMIEETGAMAAFSTTITDYQVVDSELLNEDMLFRLIPYENHVVSYQLNPGQIREIIREQNDMHAGLSSYLFYYGIAFPNGLENAMILSNTKRIINDGEYVSVAFNSYHAVSAGGRYPKLKKILINSKTISKDYQLLRSAVRNYMKRHYPILTSNAN